MPVVRTAGGFPDPRGRQTAVTHSLDLQQIRQRPFWASELQRVVCYFEDMHMQHGGVHYG